MPGPGFFLQPLLSSHLLAEGVHFTYNTPMEKGQEWLIQHAEIVLDRLERLSADSVWAHQASGLRGSIIRSLNALNTEKMEKDCLEALLQQGSQILNQAAREIPDHS